jgi:hypothetical protein
LSETVFVFGKYLYNNVHNSIMNVCISTLKIMR